MNERLFASRRVFAAYASALLLAILPACADEGGRRSVGAVCGAPAQCASGICSEQICIDPFSCVEALATNSDPSLVNACAASLSELAITPNPAQVEAGGSVQVTVSGALGSTTTGETELGREPVPGDGGSDRGGPAAPEGDFGTDSAPLTAPVDVTRAARFESSNPEVVSFDPETPGLVQVRGADTGTFTITAFIGSGELERSVEGTVVIGGADLDPEGGFGDGGGTP